MIKYIILCETGLQGSSYYYSYDEATQAAKFREYCTGLKWFVKTVMARN